MNNDKLNLFVVEDDDIDAMSLERELKKRDIDYNLIRAKDGKIAYDMIKSGELPDSVIMVLDLNVPQVDGQTLLGVIREDETLSGSVVFILTTSNAKEDVVKCYSHHVAGYFVKSEIGVGFSSVVDFLIDYWTLSRVPSINDRED